MNRRHTLGVRGKVKADRQTNAREQPTHTTPKRQGEGYDDQHQGQRLTELAANDPRQTTPPLRDRADRDPRLGRAMQRHNLQGVGVGGGGGGGGGGGEAGGLRESGAGWVLWRSVKYDALFADLILRRAAKDGYFHGEIDPCPRNAVAAADAAKILMLRNSAEVTRRLLIVVTVLTGYSG